MERIIKRTIALVIMIALAGVPLYLITHILVFGIIGYSAMTVGGLMLICRAIYTARKKTGGEGRGDGSVVS